MQVDIEIKSIHFTDEGRNEETETAVGEYHIKGDTRYIRYDSVDQDGDVSHNMIKLTKEAFSQNKKGQVNATMLLTPCKETKTNYVTPYGTFAMTFDTKEYKLEESENSHKITLKYDLSIDGKHQSRCHIFLRLNIKNDTITNV